MAPTNEKNDPELLALPLRQMELSGGTNKILKTLSCKTIGGLLSKSPEALVAAGLGAPALREIANSATEMGLTWSSIAEIAAAAPNQEPIALDLPKAIMNLSRQTYVLENWAPSNAPMPDASCSACGKPLKLLADLDLRTFPDSQLPAVSIRAGRCDKSSCSSAPAPAPKAASTTSRSTEIMRPPPSGEGSETR